MTLQHRGRPLYVGEQKRHHPRRSSRRHGIASAHFMCPSKPSDVAMRAVAIPIVAVGGVVAVGPGQQRAQPQQPDVAYNQPLVGWRGRQPVDRGLGFGHVALGTALQQRLHQNAGRRNAKPELSCMEQIVYGCAH